MTHERGDVPGPDHKGNTPAAGGTPVGAPASTPTAVPEAPLGWEQGGQTADPAKQADPVPGKYRSPSAGETKADTAR